MSLPSFFHIGLHKTASTFLQKEIFARHPQIVLRNTHRFFLNDELFLRGRDFYISLCPAEEKVKVVIESSEGLSGAMFCPGKYKVLARRIREVNPEAPVFFFIRNQVSMIESLYKQYIKERGELGFSDFLTSSTGQGVLEKVRYLEQVNFYREFFGERFNVFLFEELHRDMDGFLRKLYHLMGVDFFQPSPKKQNRGATVFTGNLYKILNRWCRRSGSVERNRRAVRHVLDFMDNNLFKYVDHRRYVSVEIRKQLWETYQGTNRVLSDLLGVRLGDYGYPW